MSVHYLQSMATWSWGRGSNVEILDVGHSHCQVIVETSHVGSWHGSSSPKVCRVLTPKRSSLHILFSSISFTNDEHFYYVAKWALLLLKFNCMDVN